MGMVTFRHRRERREQERKREASTEASARPRTGSNAHGDVMDDNGYITTATIDSKYIQGQEPNDEPELDTLNKDTLRDKAAAAGIEGYKSMNKEQLINALKGA